MLQQHRPRARGGEREVHGVRLDNGVIVGGVGVHGGGRERGTGEAERGRGGGEAGEQVWPSLWTGDNGQVAVAGVGDGGGGDQE